MIKLQRVNPETDQASDILEIDATPNVNLSHSMNVTAFPVEGGATISDHTQKLPEVVTISGIVSSTPLRLFSFNPIIGDARPRAAFEILKELQESGELIRVVTDLKTYDSMVLTNLSAPRRADTKHAVFFTATFTEVAVVSSEIVVLPPEEQVQQTATKKQEVGKVTPKPQDDPKKREKAASYMVRIGEWAVPKVEAFLESFF